MRTDGVRADVEVGREHAQVVAVARPEHHAVLAEAHRLPVAVDRRVLDVVANGHGEAPSRSRAAAQARSSSTSNSSVALGGITPPAPRAP